MSYSPPKMTALDRLNSVEHHQKKLRKIHDSNTSKDFVLISSDGTNRRAHKTVLDKSSPFFGAGFRAGLNETELNQYEMPDINTETLDILLRFMYYDCTEGLKESARTVIVAADKYQMNDLKKSCEDILAAELSNGTAADLLLLADKVSAFVLKDGALHHIAVNFKAMEKSAEINKLSDAGNNLTREIFAAVARWGMK